MGNNLNFPYVSNWGIALNVNECLKFDKVIDVEEEIYIGILPNFKNSKNLNPYSSQAIRIGKNSNAVRLIEFTECTNSLKFDYEFNITMQLTKKNNDIILNIHDPTQDKHIIKLMDPICIKFMKPIYFDKLSVEYDKIATFIKSST